MQNGTGKSVRSLLGKNVRNMRESEHISLRRFAKMVDMDYAYLSNIETGKANPTVDVLEKIANGLGCEIQDLF